MAGIVGVIFPTVRLMTQWSERRRMRPGFVAHARWRRYVAANQSAGR